MKRHKSKLTIIQIALKAKRSWQWPAMLTKLSLIVMRSEKRTGNQEVLFVSPTEPEAVVQKMKRGRGYTTGYKPSVLANSKRVALAQAVDPTNETAVINPNA